MKTVHLSETEVADILQAIDDAEAELCVDFSSVNAFPEATAYYHRLEAVRARLQGGGA